MSKYYESYIGTSEAERLAMINDLEKKSIMDFFADIPHDLLLNKPISFEGPYSEAELTRLFKKISMKNVTPSQYSSFLGGGVRQQYIPAAIEELMHRGELYTSYTPYQPEISQGMLQLIYEYQSMLAEILNMDVVNASMYDWGSAFGESLLIMKRITRRNKVLVLEPISPKRKAVASAYIAYSNLEVVYIPHSKGRSAIDKAISIFKKELYKPKQERELAGIYLEIPSYFGTLPEKPDELFQLIHEVGGIVTVGVDPISVGILTPPGDYGADFVIGEGQLLGNPISTGGPLLGIIATKYNRKWIRELPGRLIGSTNEIKGNLPGYCITLQTREQHIRREKATSNICTNQSITAVNAAIYMASLGSEGLVELSQLLYNKAHYLASELSTISGVISPYYTPFFSEFVINFENIDHTTLERSCLSRGVIPGIPIQSEGIRCLRLISVNELHNKEDLDQFVTVIKDMMT